MQATVSPREWQRVYGWRAVVVQTRPSRRRIPYSPFSNVTRENADPR
jgi:hypothetical protein